MRSRVQSLGGVVLSPPPCSSENGLSCLLASAAAVHPLYPSNTAVRVVSLWCRKAEWLTKRVCSAGSRPGSGSSASDAGLEPPSPLHRTSASPGSEVRTPVVCCGPLAGVSHPITYSISSRSVNCSECKAV